MSRKLARASGSSSMTRIRPAGRAVSIGPSTTAEGEFGALASVPRLSGDSIKCRGKTASSGRNTSRRALDTLAAAKADVQGAGSRTAPDQAAINLKTRPRLASNGGCTVQHNTHLCGIRIALVKYNLIMGGKARVRKRAVGRRMLPTGRLSASVRSRGGAAEHEDLAGRVGQPGRAASPPDELVPGPLAVGDRVGAGVGVGD